MDINTLRGLSTLFVAIAFFGVCWWAFSPSRKKRFDDAARLPFADDGFDGADRKCRGAVAAAAKKNDLDETTLHSTADEERQD